MDYSYYDTYYTDSTDVHLGLDIDDVEASSARVNALAAGTVIATFSDPWGSYWADAISVLHVTASGQQFTATYAHIDIAAGLKSGSRVGAGQQLGAMAAIPAGGTHIDHLHLEIRLGKTTAAPIGTAKNCATASSARGGTIDPLGFLRSHKPGSLDQGSNPTGHFDSATSPLPGVVRVHGWAFDPDAKTSPTTIHLYIGGRAGQSGGEGRNLGAADRSRPDVGRAYPGVGDNHGFYAELETGKRGHQQVCAYAINIGGGTNSLLGCKTVTIDNPNPFGNLDSATSLQPGTVRVHGWAIDPSNPSTSIDVHVYVGGPAGVGKGFNLGASSVARPDVGRAYPGSGDYHGFERVLSGIAAGTHEVCAYGINIGAGSNVLLARCRTVTVASAIPEDGQESDGTTDSDPEAPTETPTDHEPPDGGLPTGHSFDDIATSVHREAIEAVADAGISSGYGDREFRPDLAVTRGQVATFLARALGLSGAAGNPFVDVGDSPHSDAIVAIAEAGIAGGYEGGRFRPDLPVTRAQMATFVARALGLSTSGSSRFADIANSSHRDSIAAVAEAGIASGYEGGRFRPDLAVTRGQMATFLARAFELSD